MPKKLKIFVRYDATGILVAGTAVKAYKKPDGSGWSQVQANVCCDGAVTSNSHNGLCGYIRIDGSGNAIPGSLVIRKNHPKDGSWYIVPYKLCC